MNKPSIFQFSFFDLTKFHGLQNNKFELILMERLEERIEIRIHFVIELRVSITINIQWNWDCIANYRGRRCGINIKKHNKLIHTTVTEEILNFSFEFHPL
jgi:hypothetical protein